MLVRMNSVISAVPYKLLHIYIYIPLTKTLKKVRPISLFIACLFLLISGCSSTPHNMAGTTLQDMSFKYRNFQYMSDKKQFGKEDHWQTPSETKRNKKYDCEDISFLYYFELLENGHKPQLIYGVFPNGQAHVAVALHGWVLDGSRVYRQKHINFKVVYTFTHESITLPTPPKFFKRYTQRLDDKDRGFALTEDQIAQTSFSDSISKNLADAIPNTQNQPPTGAAAIYQP